MVSDAHITPVERPRNYAIILPMLANELLSEIGTYLPRKDQLSMVHTCWTLHGTTSRLMYRRVTISDWRARRFFKTITESDKDYGKYVRDLRYFVTSESDVTLTYRLLCDAIPNMDLLQKLTLSAGPSHSEKLLQLLIKRSIVNTDFRPSQKYDIRLEPDILHCLADLKTLILHGAIELINLARTRNITSICVTETMNLKDFTNFIDVTTNGTNRNYIIRELILTLKYFFGSRIASPMWSLAASFPNVEKLMIRTLRANALEASHILSTTPPIFPKLRAFHLNDWTILRPMFILPQEYALKQQKSHVAESAMIRQHLESVNFGTIHWDRDPLRNEWVMREDAISNEDNESNDDYNNEYPLFWDVIYNTPLPLTSAEKEIYQKRSRE